MFPFYENFLRLKTLKIRPLLYRRAIYSEALDYVYNIFINTKGGRSWNYVKQENIVSFKWLIGEVFFTEELWLEQYHYHTWRRMYRGYKSMYWRTKRFYAGLFDDKYDRTRFIPKAWKSASWDFFDDGFTKNGSLIFDGLEFCGINALELSSPEIIYC